jgi:hypothetical protein
MYVCLLKLRVIWWGCLFNLHMNTGPNEVYLEYQALFYVLLCIKLGVFIKATL